MHPVAQRRVLERKVDAAHDDALRLVDRRRHTEADRSYRLVQQLGDGGLELGEDVVLRVLWSRALMTTDNAPVAVDDAGQDLRAT